MCIVRVSSISSASSLESVNHQTSGRPRASRRQLRAWLRQGGHLGAAGASNGGVPIPQGSYRTSQWRGRRGIRLQGQLACLANERIDEDDENEETVDIYSFVDSTNTTFSPLVSDANLLQTWAESVEQNKAMFEEETNDSESNEEEIDDELASYDWCHELDSRKIHPALLSPEECYKRIGRSTRSQLNLPGKQHAIMKDLEHELVEWFTVFPDSIFIKSIPSRYDRLVLHSLCRYMNLSSYSVNAPKSEGGGGRKTYVQNNFLEFAPPDMLLSNYLESLVLVKQNHTDQSQS